MATGQLPFQGATVATIFEGLLTKEPAKPSAVKAGLPAGFDHIVSKALDKDRETRYQGAAEMRADLKRLRRATDSGVTAAATRSIALDPPKPADRAQTGWRRRALIGAPLVTILAVGGFMLYRTITTPALAEKDPVVLSTFVNRTGDTMFDDTLGDALALQLRQSPFLSLVPEQQVQGTLRMMAIDPSTPIDDDIGREVCQRAGARALLGGSVAMLGRAYVITLNAQDCVSGRVIAEQQQQADSKEAVLDTLGSAVTALREQLGESLASIQRYDATIVEGTTRSLEALKAYSEGLKTRRIKGNFDAVPFFRRAIELDPEFALAYARLGTVYGNMGQPDEARKMTARAYELREKVSEQERFYIEARYHTLVEPNVTKALDVYRVWLSAYPHDYTALVNSAILLRQQGDNDAGLRNLEAAVKVAPDEPLAWNNLANAYMEMGRLDDAQRTLETSIKLQDSPGAHINLFVIGVLTRNQPLIDAQVAALRGTRDEVDLVSMRATAAAYRGRMKEAATLTDEWVARMEAASRRPATGEGIASLAISEAIVGLLDAARARVETAVEEARFGDGQIVERLVVAALSHDVETAGELLPLAIAEQRRSNSAGADTAEKAMRALMKIAEGKPADAPPLLEPISFEARNFEPVLMWSMAHVMAGQWEPALKGLTFLVEQRSQRGFSSMKPWAMAMRARTLAQLGRKDEALKAYQAFFDLWQDADPDVPLLVAAREEFDKLTGS
jgi:tetratricopeptide (TPR) repeat protein